MNAVWKIESWSGRSALLAMLVVLIGLGWAIGSALALGIDAVLAAATADSGHRMEMFRAQMPSIPIELLGPMLTQGGLAGFSILLYMMLREEKKKNEVLITARSVEQKEMLQTMFTVTQALRDDTQVTERATANIERMLETQREMLNNQKEGHRVVLEIQATSTRALQDMKNDLLRELQQYRSSRP